MTRYVLDTNILSNLVKPRPSPELLAWMALQQDDDLHITAITVAEIWRGVLVMPAGQRRDDLATWFAGSEGPQGLFAGRVLAFDEPSAIVWARLMAGGTASGRPRSPLDMQIAAIADANGCVVVTDNERDFIGLDTLNPMRRARR